MTGSGHIGRRSPWADVSPGCSPVSSSCTPGIMAPPVYILGVVRKRCGRRSPNFSRVELECFVSLMDRYLPDELQRTGTISLRQRRAILQEIARCLEPMSGCLRTPRQLLHRWADFNNRDPERLMEIRMQLHFATNRDQSSDSSDVRPPSPLEKRCRRRISRPLSSSSSSCSEEGEETRGDPLSDVWDDGVSESPVSPDPPPQTLFTTHIDAQGRYIVPPPLPKSEERWWPPCAAARMEEQRGRPGSPGTLYSSLQEQGDPVTVPDPEPHAGRTNPGLRTIKSEPDSEEDEGGGSWSSDVPSPESVASGQIHGRKESEGQSEGPLSSVSPEDSYTLESPAGDPPEARSIKRSPNFSPAELECFVALMDHFLPDNLIRAGALPIRQRKAILQEIARRLEPLSGCLRTPRQLRHRWTDFNNRDPDRLEEIRRRLRRAGRQESCKKPGNVVESTPAAGNSWRQRRSNRLRRDIKTEEPMRPDPSEEHRPRTPWHHLGLPKCRNSFSMARLKKNRHLDIRRVKRLLRRVEERQATDLSTDEEDCAEQKTSRGEISM